MRPRYVVFAVLAAAVLAWGGPARSAPAGAPGCPLFPSDDVWHADISSLPVHARSPVWLSAMGGPDRRLHPDFGPSGQAQPYGIPYAVVHSGHQRVHVQFDYADESDPGPYPFGPDIPVESGSDRHALMLDGDGCTLYELYAAQYSSGGSTAGSGAVWNLRSHALRPAGWTSADAAGLPILPGLLRRDEVAAGLVDHAIRVTAQRTDRSYLWPARHQAGAADDPSLPPMGARFRLRAGFDVSRFRPDTQVVLRAMQRYGLILADNGSNWFFTGTAEDGWDTAMLDELKTVPAGAFDAIDESSLMVDPNSGQARGGTAPAAPPTTRRAPAPPRAPGPSPTTTVTASAPPTNAPSPSTPTADDGLAAAPDPTPPAPAGAPVPVSERWWPPAAG
ncbi:MAG: hypothetical protein QOJ09_2210, partial [Actinomycetota bacterium]|nr:hypothetical protein [Actinomycetota bacterium]